MGDSPVAIPTAFIDTNVYFPGRLADLLLSLAANGLFDLCTSEPHIDEVHRVLSEYRDSPPEVVDRFCDRLTTVAKHCVARARCEEVSAELAGPDRDDLLHLAAAIEATCDYVVTNNTTDFLEAVIGPDVHRPEVITPDEFVMRLIDHGDAEEVVATFTRMQRRLTRPPLSVDELLEGLSRNGMDRTSAALRTRLEVVESTATGSALTS